MTQINTYRMSGFNSGQAAVWQEARWRSRPWNSWSFVGGYLDVLLSQFRTSLLFMSSSNCCFLTCIQVSQGIGKVVWYSHLLENFPQLVVIHAVKGFSIVSKVEVDVFLEFPCFLGGRNGKQLQYSYRENPMNSMKRHIVGIHYLSNKRHWFLFHYGQSFTNKTT